MVQVFTNGLMEPGFSSISTIIDHLMSNPVNLYIYIYMICQQS